MEKTLYTELLRGGVEISNHESDLYCPVNEITRKILANFPLELKNATTFYNQINGELWFDIPFAYLPFWENKLTKNLI